MGPATTGTKERERLSECGGHTCMRHKTMWRRGNLKVPYPLLLFLFFATSTTLSLIFLLTELITSITLFFLF